jgi:hypothetical protein
MRAAAAAALSHREQGYRARLIQLQQNFFPLAINNLPVYPVFQTG